MFDDNYALAASKLAGHGHHGAAAGAEDEDNDFTLQQDPDKPGFVRWAEALSTRHATHEHKSSIGYWDEIRQAVALTVTKGKKHAVMGFSEGGTKYLHPDEALYLLDDGQLLMLAKHPVTGQDLRPGICRVVDEGPQHPAASPAQSPATGKGSAERPSGGKSESTATKKKPQAKWVNAEDDLIADCYDEDEDEEDEDFDGEGDDEYDDEEGDAHEDEGGVGSAKPAASSSSSSDSSRPKYLPLPAAYSFLLEHVPLHQYLVYLHLRSMGLIALRHVPLPQQQHTMGPSSAVEKGALLLHPDGLQGRMFAPSLQYADASTGMLVSPTFLSEDGSLSMHHGEAAPQQQQSSSGGGGAGTGNASGRWLMTREAPLAPHYDVYARDGITTFKPSAPGPPDFYVVIQKANECPPTPSQAVALSIRLARHMAALREKQKSKLSNPQPAATGGGDFSASSNNAGPAIAPSYSEIGGGGGAAGSAMRGRGKVGMSRAVASAALAHQAATDAAASGEDAYASGEEALSEADAQLLQTFSPNIKTAIVAHTAITFYSAEPIELKLPQKYRPRTGGPMMQTTAVAANTNIAPAQQLPTAAAVSYALPHQPSLAASQQADPTLAMPTDAR